MTRKILITQCLQNDFVRPIRAFDALPNLLHIGFGESLRLMGEDPAEGPVAQIMNWAHAQSDKKLEIIHIRDWHNAQEERQKAHLDYFGAHCLQNSIGAQFAFDSSHESSAKIVNALTLNDFIDSNLSEVLRPYQDQVVDVGLIGVWTEAKIAFLSYELLTRFPKFNLAVCSALTASSSRAQHFIALNQLEKILGVKIYDSLGEFIQFLGGETLGLEKLHKKSTDSQSLKLDTQIKLGTEPVEIIRYLFRDCKSVELKSLDGGFSGNFVLGSQSIDQYGHKQVPHVVKIGPRKLIASERIAFERIESVLGNNAPRIVEFLDREEYGAIKYRYASMGGQAESFQKIYMKEKPSSRIKNILNDVFEDQLGRLYAVAEIESCNLLKYYAFRPELAERVEKMATDAGATKSEAHILKSFYQDQLPELLKEPEYRYFSYVHGDLNGANIIVDGHDNVWLIDFFHAHRGHVLKDLAKLENDILFIYTKIKSEAELKHAKSFSAQLLDVHDLWQAPKFHAKDLKLNQFKQAAQAIRLLRSFYKSLIQADRDPYQLMVAQLRYAIHTLVFEESNSYQKSWALWTALALVNRIIERAQSSNKLRIDWIDTPSSQKQIGLTILPGRGDRKRNLKEDLMAIREAGITDIVCLATPSELKNYGVPDLLKEYQNFGFDIEAFQIRDGKAPLTKDLKKLLNQIQSKLAHNRKILIHCVGGLGRSGLVAACFLKNIGYSSEEAIATVRKQRSQRAIETKVQESFVRRF